MRSHTVIIGMTSEDVIRTDLMESCHSPPVRTGAQRNNAQGNPWKIKIKFTPPQTNSVRLENIEQDDV